MQSGDRKSDFLLFTGIDIILKIIVPAREDCMGVLGFMLNSANRNPELLSAKVSH